MPELPEVEIMRANLERWSCGRRVFDVKLLRIGSFHRENNQLDPGIVGQCITGVVRRGKVVLLQTDGPVHWLIRFGMSGKWVRAVKDEVPAYARVVIILDDSSQTHLCFCDTRNFGGIWAVAAAHSREILHTWVRGRDPLLDGLNGRELQQALAGRRTPVKVAFLDQEGVAGVGNIYASEALFRAGMHPRELVCTLSLEQCQILARTIGEVLREAIDCEKGEEIRYFSEGGDVNHCRVYLRHGQPCLTCGDIIQRAKLAGRSTFWCPTCQKEPSGAENA